MCEVREQVRTTLPSTALAPSTARRLVASWMCPSHGVDAASAVALVASELVTNALAHGAPPIELELRCEVHAIEVAVFDRDPEEPGVAADREGGLGMLLVEKISRDWGTRVTSVGKVVWCSVPTGVVPARRAAARRRHQTVRRTQPG